MSDAMRGVLGHWTTAFNSHRLDAMAELFTPDALFRGFDPEVLVGRDAVRGYYEAVPDYRSAAEVTVLHTYEIGDDLAGGFASVTFQDPDGWEARVHLSLVLERDEDEWLIRQYHVSRISSEH